MRVHANAWRRNRHRTRGNGARTQKKKKKLLFGEEKMFSEIIIFNGDWATPENLLDFLCPDKSKLLRATKAVGGGRRGEGGQEGKEYQPK